MEQRADGEKNLQQYFLISLTDLNIFQRNTHVNPLATIVKHT
jgi:hypothetical protein